MNPTISILQHSVGRERKGKTTMDRRLFDACVRGDAESLRRLVGEDELRLDHVSPPARATPLHLAARFGHAELAAEIVRLRPAMVGAENARMETPLHEVCREGSEAVAGILIGEDPTVVCRLNREGETALSLACRNGHLGVVKLLLSRGGSMVLRAEADAESTSLHSAAMSGHAEIVQELLNIRPDFVSKGDKHGFSPLHHACWKGHLGVARKLLQFDSDLCYQRDLNGRTPLHLAAIKGLTGILEEILSLRLDTAGLLTNQGETVLHLCIRNKQFEAFEYLMEKLDTTESINLQDINGNSLLHLATAGRHVEMVEYLIENTKVFVNAHNHKGCTALDLIPENASDAEALSLRLMLLRAGAERSKGFQCSQPENAALGSSISEFPQPSSYCTQEEVAKCPDMGLGNVCETAMLVAALLAMAAFSASMRPPGGVYEEGELIGTAIMANNRFFKLFTLTNDLALWASVSTVIGLAAIASLSQGSMVKHLPKIYWSLYISVSFISFSYISSRFIIVPPSTGYINWLMLPIFIISPAAHFLFFLRLRQRDKFEGADKGIDISQTASMTGMEQRPESMEKNKTELASESSLGASFLIKDISSADRPTEIGLTHRKSVHHHDSYIASSDVREVSRKS